MVRQKHLNKMFLLNWKAFECKTIACYITIMQKFFGFLGAVILTATATALLYSYSLHRSFSNRLNTASENPIITGEESQDLVRQLRRYASMQVAAEDTPTVILVTNPETVPIFQGLTGRGDVVFLYPKSQKAYLLDPRSKVSYELPVKLTPL